MTKVVPEFSLVAQCVRIQQNALAMPLPVSPLSLVLQLQSFVSHKKFVVVVDISQHITNYSVVVGFI